ncbi:MAG: response regulator [Acidobacteria bacterium]|nr:response regulator [Acidobacteriota bacterium]
MAKKILLADDSITIQKVVELTFSEGDYEVHCVGNGALAIRKIDEIVPDIALVDVMMPQRNGYDVCSHVKQDPRLAWIPVLLLTGTFEPFDPRRAEASGADGHITKPFESRALVAQVEDLLSAHPRPRAAGEPEPRPIAPSAPPESSEIVNAGQIFAAARGTDTGSRPAPPPPPESPGMASPATVRIDSRTFFPHLAAGGAGERVVETPAAGATTSLGPFDLGADEAETDPTQPFRAVAGPPPASSKSEPRAPGKTPALPRAVESTPAPPPAARGVDDAAARDAVREAAERILREVAWEILPEIAERLVKERIRQLESEAESGAPAPQIH